MLKRASIIIIIVIILLVLGFLSPWNNLRISFSQLLGFGSIENYSGLKVFSLVGEMEVYMDNQFVNNVDPSTGPLEVLEVEPGVHQVRLKRKSEPDGSYYEFNRSIKFESDVDVIISYELGPTVEFSEGHIFYAEKKFENTSTTFNLISDPDRASLYIDDSFVGETPISNIEVDLSSKHKIRLERTGYETIEFEILPESQEERDKLKGYNLNLEVNMFVPPIQIDDQSTDGSNEN